MNVHSFQITRYEFRINHIVQSVELWLLLTNSIGEDIYIGHRNLNDNIIQILNLKLSENDTLALVKLRQLLDLYEQNLVNFKELIYYNKLINSNLSSYIKGLQV